MKDYKELGVWQKAVRLTLDGCKITSHFPDAEKFGLTAQIRRAIRVVRPLIPNP